MALLVWRLYIDDGMSYDGYLFYNTEEVYDLFGDGGSWDVEQLSGATQMVAPDGRLIHWGGAVQLAEGVVRRLFSVLLQYYRFFG